MSCLQDAFGGEFHLVGNGVVGLCPFTAVFFSLYLVPGNIYYSSLHCVRCGKKRTSALKKYVQCAAREASSFLVPASLMLCS